MQSENSIHYEVAGFLDKHLAPPAWWSTFPMGGGGYHRGMSLVGKGTKKGVPDVLILWGALYGIELKTEKGIVSGAQDDTMEDIRAAGGFTAVCRSLEEVKNQIIAWGIPLLEKSLKDMAFEAAVHKTVNNPWIGHNSNAPIFPDSDEIGKNVLPPDRGRRIF